MGLLFESFFSGSPWSRTEIASSDCGEWHITGRWYRQKALPLQRRGAVFAGRVQKLDSHTGFAVQF